MSQGGKKPSHSGFLEFNYWELTGDWRADSESLEVCPPGLLSCPGGWQWLHFPPQRQSCCLEALSHGHHLTRSQQLHSLPVQADLIALCFTFLLFADNQLLQIEGLWRPCIEQVWEGHFCNSIFLIYVSNFDTFINISNYICVIFVMVVSDL